MLVFTRRIGDQVVINGNIIVTFLSVEGDGKIRLGFEAPRELPIHRAEIQERIDQALWAKDEAEAKGRAS